MAWYATGAAAENSRLILSGPARLLGAEALLVQAVAADRYLMVFDSPVQPANGAVPLLRALVPGGASGSADLVVLGLPDGLHLAQGLAVAVSTTAGSLTLPAAAEGYFQVSYTASGPLR